MKPKNEIPCPFELFFEPVYNADETDTESEEELEEDRLVISLT